MRSIVLLHAGRAVIDLIENQLRGAICEELEIHNMLDEFLQSDLYANGTLTQSNLSRLYHDIKSAELTGADLIVVTSAAVTLWLDQVRPSFSTPILGIDQPMIRAAVVCGNNLSVLATTRMAAAAAREKLLREGRMAGRELHVSVTVAERAFEALRKKDMVTYDRLLKAAALSIKNQDAVVLAQASMAHLEREIHNVCGCRVLSSPGLFVAEVKAFFESKSFAAMAGAVRAQ